MDLKEFIKTVLIDLINGVDEAKEALGQERSLICPHVAPINSEKFDLKADPQGRYYQKIEFDVAVTVAEEIATNGKVEGKAGFIKC